MSFSREIRFRLRNILHRITRSHDLPSEYRWWNAYLLRRPNICSSLQRNNAFPAQLLSIIERLKSAGTSQIRVLEVGSKPVSLLAWGVRQKLIIPGKGLELSALRHKASGLSLPVEPRRLRGESPGLTVSILLIAEWTSDDGRRWGDYGDRGADP